MLTFKLRQRTYNSDITTLVSAPTKEVAIDEAEQVFLAYPVITYMSLADVEDSHSPEFWSKSR